jgi:hypothetical protein
MTNNTFEQSSDQEEQCVTTKTYKIRDKRTVLELTRRFVGKYSGGISQRNAANELDVPRTTMRNWDDKTKGVNENQQRKKNEFLATPEGYDFVEKIISSALFVFLIQGNGSIVCRRAQSQENVMKII